MQIIQNKWLTRILFFFIALTLIVSFAAVVQADGLTPQIAQQGPGQGPPMGPPGGQQGGPMGGAVAGLPGAPMGGPTDAPMGGPQGAPMGGPMEGPMGGPMEGPMGGPMMAGMPMMDKPMDMGSCIVGHVWYDGNHDGQKDDNEDPMDGATVTLFVLGPFKYQFEHYRTFAVRVTRDGGYYEFCKLSPGTYQVEVEPAEGILKNKLVLTRGFNPTPPIMLEPMDHQGFDFGFAPPRVLSSYSYLNDPMRKNP